ncbi:MAG TPA: DUF4367 domain-containing protein [Candidatus Mediterraneibacter stercoravium]|uniref:DUF4367 domain-containing protein n=1 Tax=Candidatus Mediterraneibacter stercoravium TaxID=2838685 RepID=A0A9D2G938_9FIRM|nr:DUF4367 domain-containing protein [Candidatus Mediterraneibacter stercoravium]
MKKLKKISLNEAVSREAEQIEKEVRDRKDLDDIKVSEDMETSLFNKIQEYEYDRRLKKVYHRKKRRYIIVALAAVLVLAFGSVMTGVGSKSYWKVMWDRIAGDENASIINVEDMESQTTEDLDEMGVYREINETFGISTVRFGYKPPMMFLSKYSIDKEQRKSYLFYEYESEIIRYSLYMNDTDSSFGQKEPDKLLSEDKVGNSGVTITVEEYEVDNLDENRYIAQFEYNDVQYQLKGVMKKSEFYEIIENLVFL